MVEKKPKKDKRDREWTHCWRYFLLECQCMIDIEWISVKSKYSYKIVDFNSMKTKRVPNTFYDPSVKRPKVPKFCKKKVGMDCFTNNCPYIGFSEAEEKMCIAVEEAHDRIVKEEEKEYEEAVKKLKTEGKISCDCKDFCEECRCVPGADNLSSGVGKPRSPRTTQVHKRGHGVVPDTRDEVPDGGVDNQRG
jgi:hypothetical protein